MSLTSAMFSGVTGLQTFGNAMNVVGDNIANVNTIGFKSSKSIFTDILANSLANGAAVVQVGRGTRLQAIVPQFGQGSFETTGNATDMALEGAGFFVVKDNNGGTFYTRAGQFRLNQDGILENPTGLKVQGFKLSTSGTVTSGNIQDIDISSVQSVPRASSFFRLGLNLNAAASAGTTFSSSVNLFNSLGEQVTLTFTFTKVLNANQWTYSAVSSTGTVSTGGTGTLTFLSDGTLDVTGGDISLSITNFPSGATSPLTVNWDLQDATTGLTNGDITGYASQSVTNALIQDGFPTGTLRGVSVDSEGKISGLFSNGQTQFLFQMVLADFISPFNLTRMGDALFAETGSSGQPVFGTAQAGGFGSVVGSSLELSNVDIAAEFVSMIQNQRAFQASSRIVTTVDDMLTETVNLKR